jgi:hypothetical protein
MTGPWRRAVACLLTVAASAAAAAPAEAAHIQPRPGDRGYSYRVVDVRGTWTARFAARFGVTSEDGPHHGERGTSTMTFNGGRGYGHLVLRRRGGYSLGGGDLELIGLRTTRRTIVENDRGQRCDTTMEPSPYETFDFPYRFAARAGRAYFAARAGAEAMPGGLRPGVGPCTTPLDAEFGPAAHPTFTVPVARLKRRRARLAFVKTVPFAGDEWTGGVVWNLRVDVVLRRRTP